MLVNLAGAWLFGSVLDYVFRMVRCWIFLRRFQQPMRRHHAVTFALDALVWPIALVLDVRRIVRNARDPWPTGKRSSRRTTL